MRYSQAIGNRLSRVLYVRGWTDTELAARTGIARSRVNRIKNRRSEPTVAEALAICTALERRVAEVFVLGDELDGSRPSTAPPLPTRPAASSSVRLRRVPAASATP